MPVLYRDYRPKSFAEVIDQEHIKQTLQNAVAQGTFAHAYLFTGPRGTGKTSVARIFARAINCLHASNGEPDNSCAICKQFLDGTSLDLIEIDAASNTGVENIRDITEHLKFSPTQAKYKVFIIDEVHMLSKGAFNALLKTLEEPPAHAVFILATTEVHKVPATVTSRTQRFDFHKLDSNKLLAHLKEIAKQEKIVIDDQSLQLVVNAAEGSGRDALSILDKLSSFGKVDLAAAEQLLGLTNIEAVQKFLDLLIAKDGAQSLSFLEELFSAGTDPVQFNKDFLEYLRKVLMSQFGAGQQFALDQIQLARLNKQSAEISQTQLLYIVRLFLRANKDFQVSPSLELPLEIAAAEACMDGSVVKAEPAKSEKAAVLEHPASKSEIKKKREGKVMLSQIQAIWPSVLQKIKAKQSSLMSVLQMATLKEVDEENCLVLSFVYKLHKDNLQKNAVLLLETISEELGQDIGLKLVLEKDLPPQSDAAGLALEVFGGELV